MIFFAGGAAAAAASLTRNSRLTGLLSLSLNRLDRICRHIQTYTHAHTEYHGKNVHFIRIFNNNTLY